ncbi:MAG: mycothiol system anti-sigma-R factor [Gemmatimonadetes bacterium]|nr:mycothiol system anti-sigma-R factor [Gemmatimonadota bacterium]MCH8144758.1 mycothiol system anti-sigma-R factor [Gemmatimonadota bacterium]MCH8938869.1 mycothiol system anti-sigma-R factor [Gemmatimonadota bacterium]
MTSEPMQVDCKEAAKRLNELIDGELTPEVEETIEHHLKDCARCMAVFEFEEAFCRFVKIKAKRQTAPEGLKERILKELGLSGNSCNE